MNFAAYPKHESYKGSGIDWIGEVPTSWSVEPGRQCLYESKEKNIGMKESTVLSLSYGRVIVKDKDKLTGLVPESFETYQVVQPGDIIIRGTDLQNDMTSLRTGLARDTGIITSAYINLRPKAEIDPKFLHYLLHSYDVKKIFYALGSGLRQNLSYEDFKYLRLPIPSPDEQRAIAVFLDGKCATIDEAVRIKEEQIRLLAERRQILIQQAVTRGLNPDAPMKDSGIDWIGQIPAHWEVMPFTKYCKSIVDYRGKTPEKIEEGVLLVTAKNVREGFLDYEVSREYIKPSSYEMVMSRGKPKRGDILFTTEAPLGKVAIVDDESVALAQRIIKFRLKDQLVSEYVNFYLNSHCFQDNLATMGTGSTAMGIKASKLNKLLVIMPPIEEQNAVAQRLEATTAKFSSGISIKNEQIAALKEYKTSLINAAVTGKIKVI